MNETNSDIAVDIQIHFFLLRLPLVTHCVYINVCRIRFMKTAAAVYECVLCVWQGKLYQGSAQIAFFFSPKIAKAYIF